MSTNLSMLLRDSSLNNTYDYSVLHQTLKDTWTNSYSYLYQLQLSLIEYEEHIYKSNNIASREVNKIGHLYINKSSNACFDIDYDFIHVCNREEFKHSKFFDNTFTINDINNNPKIFTKIPIILIDGKAIWDYKLYAHNGKFTVILPFGRSFVLSMSKTNTRIRDSVVFNDHVIQVFIVDNISYQRLTLNRSNILNTKTKSLSIKTSLIKNVKNKQGIYFVSIHIPNINGENYELGTRLMPCVYSNNTITCELNPEDYSHINKYTKNLYVSIIFVNNLYLHKFYNDKAYTTCIDNECNIFMLQQDECVPYTMPIPIENLMVIRKRDNVLTYVKNTDAVELYYPNIYHIKDKDRQENDVYYIYYFYKHDESLKYTSLYNFYYQFLKIRYNDAPIEQIVDHLFRGRLVLQGIDGEIDFNNISKLFANCGTSTISTNPKYLINCGTSSIALEPPFILYCNDGKITVDEEYLSSFLKVLQYEYYNHRYGEIDFTKRYLLESENILKTPIEYKDETLREWISKDPSVLQKYVINQNKLYDSVYHFWTKSTNLKKRIRTSTTQEVGKENGVSLPEECYVFAFRNDNTLSRKPLNIRVFVDGLLVVRLTQIRHYFTDYLYIPTKLVTDDSYIEVEIFPSYEYNKTLHFSSLNDEEEIELFEPVDKIYPTASDVYYISPNGHMYESLLNNNSNNYSNIENIAEMTSTQAVSLIVNGNNYDQTQIYNSKLFELTAMYNSGNYTIKTTDENKPVNFTRLNRFKIKPLSQSVLNTDIIFCISKISTGLEIEISADCPYISLVGNNFNPDINYIRIFKNGRMVSRNRYVFYDTYSFHRIAFSEKFKKGDILYIDITPYKYKEVYYQEEIQEGQNIIDLHNYIDKPFDIRYYDVYLNGRKLSLNNVILISPWTISLVNIKSIYNLQIFEKERDYEYFGKEFKETDYYYTFNDLFDSTFINEHEKSELINRIINSNKDDNLTIKPNENTEEKLIFGANADGDSINTCMFYRHELVPKTYMNPDKLQVSTEIVESMYPNIKETYYTTPAEYSRNSEEHERRQEYKSVYFLDPDKFVEGNLIESDYKHKVYSIGHLGDVSENILNKSVNSDMNNIAE